MLNQKFFSSASKSTIPSRINSSLNINSDKWVISLITRKLSKNPRHAFLILEGITSDGLGILCRYDLVAKMDNQDFGQALLFTREKIDIAEMPEMVEKLVKLEKKQDALYYKSWHITPKQAAQLHSDVESDSQRDIPYSVYGEESISSNKADNCFTWARKKLNNLNDPAINIKPKLTDFIAANPHFYLDSDEPTSKDLKCLVM